MKTLALRVARAGENAAAVAEWAAGRREFTAVHWPGFKHHPDHKVARGMLRGFGGMVGLELAGGAAAAERFCSRLQLVLHATSLGGVESLISEPRLTSHKAYTPSERARLGFPDGFLRLSCGCEDAADLIADLEGAL
jgi:cystathionine beta-lyase/cystathionine gamma-synthase